MKKQDHPDNNKEERSRSTTSSGKNSPNEDHKVTGILEKYVPDTNENVHNKTPKLKSSQPELYNEEESYKLEAEISCETGIEVCRLEDEHFEITAEYLNDKNVPSVDVVIAIKQAIDKRQKLIKELQCQVAKSKESLECLRCTNDEMVKTCKTKEEQCTKLRDCLQELENKQSILCSTNDKLKDQNESYRYDNQKLSRTYECSMKELAIQNRKVQELDGIIEKLERTLRHQEEDTEKWRKSSEYYECELSKSRDSIEMLNKMIEDRQEELNELRSKISSCESEQETEGIDVNLKKELAKTLEDIRSETEKNVLLTETLNQSYQKIEFLEMENDQLKLSLNNVTNILENVKSHNYELCQELSEMTKKNNHLETSLIEALDKLTIYEARIKEIECQKEKLLAADQLKEELIAEYAKKLEKSSTFSKDLELKISFMSAEIEKQQLILSEYDSQIVVLKNHKEEACEKLKDATKMDKRRVAELQKLNADNCRLRDNLVSLKEQYDKATNEIFEKQKELADMKNCVQRTQEYIVEITTKHKHEVEQLESKLKNLNNVWQNHVEDELCKLKVQYEQSLQYNCENYIKMLKESDGKTYDTKDHDIAVLMEEINVVKRQLELSSQKLEEAMVKSQSERREVIEAAMNDRQRLMEKFSNLNISASCYGSDFEERLQTILNHYICDSRAFDKLEVRNKDLKERIKKLKEINRHYKSMEESLHSLTIERDQLKADLSHVKGLMVIMETTNERLMKEAVEFSKSVSDLSQELERSHKERIVLVKQLGQRNAYVEFLNGLIGQLKGNVKDLECENKKLLIAVYSYEHEKHVTEKELIKAQKDMADMKSSLEIVTKSKNSLMCSNTDLINQVSGLKGEVSSLKTQMENKNERLKLLQDEHTCCLENQKSLRERLNELQLSAPTDNSRFEEAKSEIEAHKKQIAFLHRHIDEIIEEQKFGKDSQRDQLDKLTNNVKDKRSNVKKLTEIINSEKEKSKRIRSCLAATDEAFYYFVNMFDAWCTSLSKICLTSYKSPLDEMQIDHRCCQDNECQLCERMEQLGLFENFINNLNEKIKEAYNNEAVYKEKVKELKYDLSQLRNTEEHEKEKLRMIIGDLDDKLVNKNNELQQLEDQILEIKLSQTNYSNKFVSTFSNEEHNKFIVCVKDDMKKKLDEELAEMKSKSLQIVNEKHKVECELQECQSQCVTLRSRVATLECELEGLKRLSAEFNAKEISYIEKISDMDKVNHKLMHELTEARLMLASCQNKLEICEQNRKSSISSENICSEEFHCLTECPHAVEYRKNNEILVKTMQEKLDSSRNSEHKTRLDMIDMEKHYKILQNRYCALESEKASLEGWVTQLQEIFKENKLQYYFMGSNNSERSGENEGDKNNIERINTLKEINNEMATKYHFLKQQYESVKQSLMTGSVEEKFSKVNDFEQKIFELTAMINERENQINQLKCEVQKCKCKSVDKPSVDPKKFTANIMDPRIHKEQAITACEITYANKGEEKSPGVQQMIINFEKTGKTLKCDSGKTTKDKKSIFKVVSSECEELRKPKMLEKKRNKSAKFNSAEPLNEKDVAHHEKKTNVKEFFCQDCEMPDLEKSKDNNEANKPHSKHISSPKKKEKKGSIIRMWHKSKKPKD